MLKLTQHPHACLGLRAGVLDWELSLFPLGLRDASSSFSELGLLLPGAERELALGGRTCSSEGCSRERGQGEDRGSVSGQQGIPTFVGGDGGALQHQALHLQAAPRHPVTQELEAFQFQGLVGRLLEMGW